MVASIIISHLSPRNGGVYAPPPEIKHTDTPHIATDTITNDELQPNRKMHTHINFSVIDPGCVITIGRGTTSVTTKGKLADATPTFAIARVSTLNLRVVKMAAKVAAVRKLAAVCSAFKKPSVSCERPWMPPPPPLPFSFDPNIL